MGKEHQLLHSVLPIVAYMCHVVSNDRSNAPPFVCTTTPFSTYLCKLVVHFLTIYCKCLVLIFFKCVLRFDVKSFLLILRIFVAFIEPKEEDKNAICFNHESKQGCWVNKVILKLINYICWILLQFWFNLKKK